MGFWDWESHRTFDALNRDVESMPKTVVLLEMDIILAMRCESKLMLSVNAHYRGVLTWVSVGPRLIVYCTR